MFLSVSLVSHLDFEFERKDSVLSMGEQINHYDQAGMWIYNLEVFEVTVCMFPSSS